MSLSLMKPLNPVSVVDPVIDFSEADQENNFAVIKGASSINILQQTPTGGDTSDSQVDFNIYFPSRTQTCLDRCVVLSATVTVNLTATLGGGQRIIETLGADRFALAQGTIGNAISNCTVDFDGQAWNVNMDQWYRYMQYFWNSEEDCKLWNTSMPTMLDNSAFYRDKTKNNVLAMHQESQYDSIHPRGSFQIKSITQRAQDAVPATPAALTTIVYEVRQPLPLSPFLCSQNYDAEDIGFINVTNLKIKLTFANNLFDRCFCINNTTADTMLYTSNGTAVVAPTFGRVLATTTNLAGTLKFSAIKATCIFKQLQATTIPPQICNYPWTNITYVTQNFTAAITGAATTNGAIFKPGLNTLVLNSYQLSVIPTRVVFFVIPDYETSDMPVAGSGEGLVSLKPYERPLMFLPVAKANILFGNLSGILNNADSNTLYQYSLKNGLRWISYTNSGMSGCLIPAGVSATTGLQLEVPQGSPQAFGYCTDIFCNDPSLSPGTACNTTFQVTLDVYNFTPQLLNIKVITLYLYDGLVSLGPQGGSWSYSILSRQDVLNADQAGGLSINDLSDPLQYGGSFWGKMKKYSKKGWKMVKSPQFRHTLTNLLDLGADLGIPGVSNVSGVASRVLDSVDNISRGPQGQGSAYVAGRLISNRQLMNGSAMVAGGSALSAAQLKSRLLK